MTRILICLMSIALTFPVFAETLTMKGTNSTATKIMIKLYSSDRPKHVWPTPTTHYPLKPGETASFNLSCMKNEKICYGAKRDNNTNSTWGIGFDGKGKCTNCCYTCNNGTFSINLTNSAGS